MRLLGEEPSKSCRGKSSPGDRGAGCVPGCPPQDFLGRLQGPRQLQRLLWTMRPAPSVRWQGRRSGCCGFGSADGQGEGHKEALPGSAVPSTPGRLLPSTEGTGRDGEVQPEREGGEPLGFHEAGIPFSFLTPSLHVEMALPKGHRESPGATLEQRVQGAAPSPGKGPGSLCWGHQPLRAPVLRAWCRGEAECGLMVSPQARGPRGARLCCQAGQVADAAGALQARLTAPRPAQPRLPHSLPSLLQPLIVGRRQSREPALPRVPPPCQGALVLSSIQACSGRLWDA